MWWQGSSVDSPCWQMVDPSGICCLIPAKSLWQMWLINSTLYLKEVTEALSIGSLGLGQRDLCRETLGTATLRKMLIFTS